MRSELFGRKSQEILNVQSKGDVLTGLIEISPEVYVDYNGSPRRLIDILNLKPGKNQKYYLTLRGTKTKTGDEIWPGKDAIEKLNSSRGIHRSTFNFLNFSRLSNSYTNMYSNLTAAKMEANFLSAIGEVEKFIRSTNPELKMEARVGNLMNLVDPFMPIDRSLLRYDKGFGNVRDYSKFKVYGDIQDQSGLTQSYVGNTFISFSRIQDTDTDTLQILQIALRDTQGNLKGIYTYDKKFPHTTHQMGTQLPANQLDFEGEAYDPLKIYRRSAGVFGSSRDPSLISVHGNQGLSKGLAQAAKLADNMSLEKTFKNQQKLKELIQGAMKENMTGMYTASQWQYEALQAEQILNKLPEFLAEQYQMTPDKINEVMSRLSSPGARAKFKFSLNQGFKGVRLEGTETIQKSRADSINSLIADKNFEALALEVAYDYQEKLLSKGNPAALGNLSQLGLTESFLQMSSEERLRAVYGISSPKFKKTNKFKNNKTTKSVSFVPADQLRLVNDEGRKGYLLDSIMDAKLQDRTTGRVSSLFEVQEISLEGVLGNDYTKTLPEDQRKNATKAYILTMNNVNENGNLIRSPLSGAHPSIQERTRKEMSWVLTSTYDTQRGVWIDPLELIKEKIEMASQYKLSPNSHLAKYGVGELTGAYSITNLRRPGGMKYLKKLADANKVSVERVRALVMDGKPKSMQMLKMYKTHLDIASTGDTGTTVIMDIQRLLKEVLGGMGVDVEVKRAASGNMYFTNLEAHRHIAEMVTMYTGIEGLDPGALAERLAKVASSGQFLGAMKQSKEDETITFGTRGMSKDGRVVSPLSGGETFAEYKRIAKRSKIGQHDLQLGETRLALVSFDFKKDALGQLGYKVDEKGNIVARFTDENGKPLNIAFGDKDSFQAQYADEGVFLGTEALQNKIEEKILENMEFGVDYSDVRRGEFQHEYRLQDPLTGRVKVMYTKKPVESQRLLSSRLGDLRVVPTFGELKRATTMINGTEQEIYGLLTLGESLSKSGMPEILAQKSREHGIYNEFLEAVSEVQQSGKEGVKAETFLKLFQEKAGSDVKITYGKDAETNLIKNAIVFNMDVTARNLDADQQIHRMSNFGTYVDKIKAFMATTEGGTSRMKEQLEYKLSGQSSRDTVFEISKSMHSFLVDQGVIDPEAVQDIDIADIMYRGYERMSDFNGPPKALGRGSSLLDQLSFTGREFDIEKAARALRLGTHATQSLYEQERMLRNEAALAETLDHTKQYAATSQAFQQGFKAAVGEVGLDNVDTLMRAFFGALG